MGAVNTEAVGRFCYRREVEEKRFSAWAISASRPCLGAVLNVSRLPKCYHSHFLFSVRMEDDLLVRGQV